VAAEAEHKPLFMVLDPEGTIIRVADDGVQYDNVVAVHVVDRLKRELPAGWGARPMPGCWRALDDDHHQVQDGSTVRIYL